MELECTIQIMMGENWDKFEQKNTFITVLILTRGREKHREICLLILAWKKLSHVCVWLIFRLGRWRMDRVQFCRYEFNKHVCTIRLCAYNLDIGARYPSGCRRRKELDNSPEYICKRREYTRKWVVREHSMITLKHHENMWKMLEKIDLPWTVSEQNSTMFILKSKYRAFDVEMKHFDVIR